MVHLSSTGLDEMDWSPFPEPIPDQLPEALGVDAMDWQGTVDEQCASWRGCCAMEWQATVDVQWAPWRACC